jgi:RimJ/RimL family protein N-acetyltransferase
VDIVTERLNLHALTPEEARRIVERTPDPADRWHAEYPFADELDPLRSLAGATAPDPFFTLYAIRARPENTSVGGIGFFGPPGNDGSVELGYGLVEAARGRGFATEALLALVSQALVRGARQVKADTELQNRASQRVLEKAGFREVSRSANSIFYTYP